YYSLLEKQVYTCGPSGPGCPSSQEKLFLRRLGTDFPSSPAAGDTAATGMLRYLGSPVTSGSDSTVGPLLSWYPCIPMQPIPLVEVDYKTNLKVKPPYSQASLICMAMQASKQPKITLSTIYKWITENFCYYTHAEPSWKNSIRHILSHNKCFRMVPKQKDEPGKGGFWQIDPEYADMFVNGIFKPKIRIQKRNKCFQGCQETVSTSANEGVSPDPKPLLSKNNRSTTKSTKTPLLATKPDSMRRDILAAALDDVLWAEVTVDTVTVPPTFGFCLSEDITATCDHPPPTTLTELTNLQFSFPETIVTHFSCNCTFRAADVLNECCVSFYCGKVV
uniref:Forkhead box J1b n=1 Tax=Gouania willdenowi TaxID=441366 RepID=A0A8C5HTJ9_GOUWI